MRDLLIAFGVTSRLLNLLRVDAPVSLRRSVSCAVLNLCHNEPPPSKSTIAKLLPALQYFIQSNDKFVSTVKYSSCTYTVLISYLYTIEAKYSQLFFHSVFKQLLIDAVWTLYQLAGAGDDHIQMLMDFGLHKSLVPLLGHKKKCLQVLL